MCHIHWWKQLASCYHFFCEWASEICWTKGDRRVCGRTHRPGRGSKEGTERRWDKRRLMPEEEISEGWCVRRGLGWVSTVRGGNILSSSAGWQNTCSPIPGTPSHSAKRLFPWSYLMVFLTFSWMLHLMFNHGYSTKQLLHPSPYHRKLILNKSTNF